MNKRIFKKKASKIVVDESLIPKQTPYCYSIDRERIKSDKTLKEGELPIIMCPYFHFGNKDERGCLATGFYGFDVSLFDRCKICKY